MGKNQKNWGSIKYPKKSLLALFWILILLIPGYKKINEELDAINTFKHQLLNFSNASKLLSPFIIVGIIFLFCALVCISFKNDNLIEKSKSGCSILGLKDIIIFTFSTMLVLGLLGILISDPIGLEIPDSYCRFTLWGFIIGVFISAILLDGIANEFEKKKEDKEIEN